MFLKPQGTGGRGDASYFLGTFFTFAARSATELVKPHLPIRGLQNAVVSIKPACSHGPVCQSLYSFHSLRAILTSGLLLHPRKTPVRHNDRRQRYHFTDEETETQKRAWLTQRHVQWARGGAWDANTQLALCLQWSGKQQGKGGGTGFGEHISGFKLPLTYLCV